MAIADVEVPQSDAKDVVHRRRRTLEWILVIGTIALFGWLSWHARVLIDDGYIYLHVVQQMIAGHGPVYNTGQRVEAFTGPLWTFLLVPSVLVSPVSMERTSLVLGDLLGMAGMAAAAQAARMFWRRQSPEAFLAPVGLLVPVAVFAFWLITCSGLELGLSLAWLGGCALILAANGRRPDPTLHGMELLVLGLGPLIRPEFVIYSLVAVLWSLIARRHDLGRRGLLAAAAWAAALPVAYEIFRMGYFGEIVANTAIAKEATRADPSRGIGYLANFVELYWIWIPVLCIVIGALLPAVRSIRSKRASSFDYAPVLVLPLAAMLNIAYITVMGGDYMAGRLLLPGIFAFVAPFALLPVRRSQVVAFLVVPWAAYTAIAVRPVIGLAGLPYLTQFSQTVNRVSPTPWEAHGLHINSPGSRVFFVPSAFHKVANELRVRPSPGLAVPSVATKAIGAVAVAFGDKLNIIDLYGLADPIDAHLQHRNVIIKFGDFEIPPLPGHEKLLPPAWFVAMTSAPGTSIDQYGGKRFLIQYRENTVDPALKPRGSKALEVQAAWARATLRCPATSAFIASYEAPLTVTRFISNLVHAFPNSQLRIDPDPKRAYHQLCGPGTPSEVRKTLQIQKHLAK